MFRRYGAALPASTQFLLTRRYFLLGNEIDTDYNEARVDLMLTLTEKLETAACFICRAL